jgi:hypothetical protein
MLKAYLVNTFRAADAATNKHGRYTYLIVQTGKLHFLTTSDPYECDPTPDGLPEAIKAWRANGHKFAGLSLETYLDGLGIKL